MFKPSLPQGMRDFTAETVRKRDHILSTIRKQFELYGYEPLETPAMENLETLMGKYGEEGDRLIFKVLNNGLSDPKKTLKAREGFENVLNGKNSALLTERALKYDLTIPFARHVAMNHGQLTFPYKRYQMQPVWRADRPQKGRYREFTQCDADVVGSVSLLNEIELVHIYHDVFTALRLPHYSIKINNRKVLEALAELCGAAEHLVAITTAIDKLDKIGLEKVRLELQEHGITNDQTDIIEKYLALHGTNTEKIAAAGMMFGNNTKAVAGLTELKTIIDGCDKTNLEVDFTLARGLNYYTGTIFEAKAPDAVKIGSIGGGGRYDDLTGLFGVRGIPGIGISFGVDRIFDVLEELNLFPESLNAGCTALFFNQGAMETTAALRLARTLRSAGVSCEVYPEQTKLEKQFRYAEKKQIPYAVLIGSDELDKNAAIIKDLSTGTQEVFQVAEVLPFFIHKEKRLLNK